MRPMELGFRGVVQALRVSRSPVDGLFDWFLLLKMDQAIRLVKWLKVGYCWKQVPAITCRKIEIIVS